MTESLVWSKESLIDISTDTMSSYNGTATIDNYKLVLSPVSDATFVYNFNTSDNVLQTTNMQLILQAINSNTEVSSRYDESVQVEITLEYYTEIYDESHNLMGYEIGKQDKYQINNYFAHEVDGYTDIYEIETSNHKVSSMTIKYINNSDNTITFVIAQLFNSMDIVNAIKEYSNEDDEDVPGTPPLIDGLMLYSTSGDYTIDKKAKQLVLEVYVPDELILQHSTNSAVYLTWIFTKLSGNPAISKTSSHTYRNIIINDGEDTRTREFTISSGRQVLTGLGDGILNVRVELRGDSTIYAERSISIMNKNINDMELEVQTESGNIDTVDSVKAKIKLLPESNINIDFFNQISIVAAPYSNNAKVLLSSDEVNWYKTGEKLKCNVTEGIITLYIKTENYINGKVKLIATTTLTNENYPAAYPTGFTKEFIINTTDLITPDYVKLEIPSGVAIDSDGSIILDDTIDRIQLSLTCDDEDLKSTSSFGITKLSGPDAIGVEAIRDSNSTGRKLKYSIIPYKTKDNVTGSIPIATYEFWVKVETYVTGEIYYISQIIYITGVKNKVETTLESNTGIYYIGVGGQQLEIYPKTNFNWHGGFSFTQTSLDGGSVTIVDKGDYAVITGDKNGNVRLYCWPEYGPSAYCDIKVKGQYPEDVILTTAEDIDVFRVPINGNLTVYAEAGNTPNSNYNRYSWVGDKIDPDVNFSLSSSYLYTQITGKALGKFRLNCNRYIDGKFMTSQIIKVVQSLNDKIVLDYPNTHTYWMVYKRTDQDNKLWLLTIDGTVTLDKLIKKNDNRLYTDNVTLGTYAQYNLSGEQWKLYLSSNAGTSPASNVGTIYASNIDIYDNNWNWTNGNIAGDLLVIGDDTYDDVDFNAIIYGETIEQEILGGTPADKWILEYLKEPENLKHWYNSIYTLPEPGVAVQLIIKDSNGQTTNNVVYRSTNNNVATVDQTGIITALNWGITDIIIYEKSTGKQCLFLPVDVCPGYLLEESYDKFYVGDTITVMAYNYYYGGNYDYEVLVYESTDDNIATVDTTGKVYCSITAVNPGTCAIKAYDTSKNVYLTEILVNVSERETTDTTSGTITPTDGEVTE